MQAAFVRGALVHFRTRFFEKEELAFLRCERLPPYVSHVGRTMLTRYIKNMGQGDNFGEMYQAEPPDSQPAGGHLTYATLEAQEFRLKSQPPELTCRRKADFVTAYNACIIH